MMAWAKGGLPGEEARKSKAATQPPLHLLRKGQWLTYPRPQNQGFLSRGPRLGPPDSTAQTPPYSQPEPPPPFLTITPFPGHN